MKFYRSFLFFLFFIPVLAIAQTDTIPYKILKDSAILHPNDSLPSSLFIGGISIYGNKKTRAYIITRELPFKTGDTITPARLAKDLIIAKQQLVNTSLFLDVYVYIEHRYGEFVFITVFVKERWYIFPFPYFRFLDPNFNTWWVTYDHSLKRTNYGIKFLHSNITGRNDKFTAWLITGYSKQVALKYERPYFDKKLKSGFLIYSTYIKQRELNYATDSSKQQFIRPEDNITSREAIKIETDYTYRPGLRIKHIFRAGYIYEKIADTILTLNDNYFANGKTKQSYPFIGYTFRYSNADYNAYPTRGLISESTILHRGVNSEMNLTQLTLINSYTIPVRPKTLVQLKEGGVLNLPFNQPFYNKSMFGYYGNIFMRGYEYYVIDGDAGIIGRATLLQEILNFKTNIGAGKNSPGFPFRFYAKIYTDAGYAYNQQPGNSLLNNRMLHTWGLGIDMITAYDVVLKLDYSFNQLGGNGLFLHLTSDF
jgi:outer membrane protein assembly factor BamA